MSSLKEINNAEANFQNSLKELIDVFVDEKTINKIGKEFEQLSSMYERYISVLIGRISSVETSRNGVTKGFFLKPEHDNIVTRSAIESLIENIDDIPIDKLEKFINQFKK